MTDNNVFDTMPEWVEHQERVAAAQAEVDRLGALVERARVEHRAALVEWEQSCVAAIADNELPPPRPGDRDQMVASAWHVQRALVDTLRRDEGPAILADLRPAVQAAVAERSTVRNKLARELLDQLAKLHQAQRADQQALKRVVVAVHRGNPPRPHPSERVHDPASLAEYVAAVEHGTDWTKLRRALGQQAKVQRVDDEPWRQSTSRGELRGPEFERLRTEPVDTARAWL